MTPRTKKLLERARGAMRVGHYACRTEKTSVCWTEHVLLYHSKRHPLETGEAGISESFTYPAADKRAAPSITLSLPTSWRIIRRMDASQPCALCRYC